MIASRFYEEVMDFLASGATPEEVIRFRPSDETKQHVWSLIRRKNSGDITPEESSELEHFLRLEHIMRLAKARARS